MTRCSFFRSKFAHFFKEIERDWSLMWTITENDSSKMYESTWLKFSWNIFKRILSNWCWNGWFCSYAGELFIEFYANADDENRNFSLGSKINLSKLYSLAHELRGQFTAIQ